MPEIRTNPILDEWVIIAPDRAHRPRDYVSRHRAAQSNVACPFCPGHESSTPPAITECTLSTSTWDIRVVPNKYPALRIEGNLCSTGDDLGHQLTGIGAHEVIIESSRHLVNLADFTVDHLANILQVWRERILDLQNDARFKHVAIFRNQGAQAGATLEHSHSQLIALPLIPKRIQEEVRGSEKYFQTHATCPFCDIISATQQTGMRLITETEHSIACTPFASRVPFETWILPKHHLSKFEYSGDELYEDVAETLLLVVRKLNRALDYPSFNLILHSTPMTQSSLLYYHWHIEIIPRLSVAAGFEWNTGYFINSTLPEIAAEHLRNIKSI